MSWWFWVLIAWPIASVATTAFFCAVCRAGELEQRQRELARVRVRADRELRSRVSR